MTIQRLFIMRFTSLASWSLWLSWLMIWTSTGGAQTTDVYGVVVDSLTRQRIPFANVSVVGTTWGAAGNNLGFYFVSKLPIGKYEIAVSSIGYVKSSKTVIASEGRPVELNFELVSIPIQSDEVVVTAPRRRLELEIKSTSVHVLEGRDVKSVPVAGQEDLLQSLKILPGVVSTSDVSSRFYVRGGAGDQNLFLYDGIRIYYPFHAMGIYSLFSPDVVDNVEVYTGAFPPGFGGKLSSVVNIIARDGRSDKLTSRAQINFLSSEITLEGPVIEPASFVINARKSISSQTFGRIIGQEAPISFYDASAKVSAQFGGVAKISLTALTSSDDLTSRSIGKPSYSWRCSGLALSGSGVPIEKIFLNSTVYVSSYVASRGEGAAGAISPASTRIKDLGLRTSITYYAGPQDLYHLGFDFGFPTLEYVFINRLGYRPQLESAPLEASAWLRYSTELGPFTFDGGIHLELGYLTKGREALREIQPRINASYLLTGTWRAKASFGRFTQRTITIDNEDDVMSLFDAWVSFSDDTKSEQSDHYVLGISGNVTEHAIVNIESYYKRYNTLFVYNRDKIEAGDPDYIEGDGDALGVEMMLRSRSQYIDWYATYSFGWVKINNAGLVYHPRYDRRHHVNLMAIGRPVKGLTGIVKWEYGSGFPYTQTVAYLDRLMFDDALPGKFERETGAPYVMLGPKNAARLPAYHRLDISISYSFQIFGLGVEVGGNILNVYDNKNIFYFDRKTGERVNMLSFFPSVSITVSR